MSQDHVGGIEMPSQKITPAGQDDSNWDGDDGIRRAYKYDPAMKGVVLPTGRSSELGGGSYGFDVNDKHVVQNIISCEADGDVKIAKVTAADLMRVNVPSAPTDQRRFLTPEELRQMADNAETAYRTLDAKAGDLADVPSAKAQLAEPEHQQPAFDIPTVNRHEPTAASSLPVASFDMFDQQKQDHQPERQPDHQAPPERAECQPVEDHPQGSMEKRANPAYVVPSAMPGGMQEGQSEFPYPQSQLDGAQFNEYDGQVSQPGAGEIQAGTDWQSMPQERIAGHKDSAPIPVRRSSNSIRVRIKGPWGTTVNTFSYVFRDDIFLILIVDHRHMESYYELPEVSDGDAVHVVVTVNGKVIDCLWSGISFTMPDDSATFTLLFIQEEADRGEE
jgi:hypothetical protein